jgi:multidrug efflux pump subunit AcrB
VERLIRFFVDRHLLVNVIVAVVIALGVFQLSRTSRETFPNVTLPRLFLNAVLPGASARDVETKLTIPIQDAVEELDGVKEFYTTVADATSMTEVRLHEEFEADRVRDAERDLRVLLDGIKDFPPEMEDDPRITRFNPKLFPVVEVALAGPTDSIVETARVLERELRALDEVSRVTLTGLQDPEVRILVDPARARAHGVTLIEVVDAVRRRNVSSTGGMLESEADRRQVVLWSRFADPAEVGSTVLRFLPNGAALTVADVARIEVGREDIGLIAHTNGQPGISITAVKQEDADIIRTVDVVRATVDATPMPPGVTATIVNDESFMARNRLELMFNNGAIGGVLVAVILFVFLTPSSAALTMIGIPVVFLSTLMLFPLLDYSINMVTLTGLVVVLGMVVDAAIVVAERIVSRRQAGEGRKEASVAGTREMASPVIASAVTTMLAFIPLWGMAGMSGRMTESMPSVVIMALTVSVLVSFLILPAHMSMGGGRRETPKRQFMVRLEARYRRALDWALGHRARLAGIFLVALVAIFVGIAPRLGVVLYPQDDSEALYVRLSLPPGTPLERTEAVVTSIERQLPAIMGEDLIASLGRIGHRKPERHQIPQERGSAENEGIVTAVVRPAGRTYTAAEWVEILQRDLVIPAFADFVIEAETMGPPVGMPVTLHVAGNVDEERRAVALEVAEWLRQDPHLVSVDVDERPGTPQIDLVLDYERLALRGLDPDAVARTVQTAFHGMVASEHRDLEETTDLRVMLDPDARRSLDALLELPVRSARGELVRLRDVVTPIELPAVSRLYHRDGRRTATVTAQFLPGAPWTALSFADYAEAELIPRFADHGGIDVTVGGEAVETRKTTGDLGLAALLAFAGITLVIALMLGSFLEAAFVVAIIPFAVAGVLLVFFLHQQPLSMFAMMGAIGLAGVVVNASIVMVDAVHRRVRGVEDPAARHEALIEAVVSRLRPIVVTTLTTLGGVLPMAYGVGGYDAVVAPMSLALGWGLVLSTLITLFLVPALYTLAGDLRAVRVGHLVERLRRPRARRERPGTLPEPATRGVEASH